MLSLFLCLRRIALLVRKLGVPLGVAMCSSIASAQATSVPFPKSSPRPAAVLVYCNAVLANRIEATHDSVTSTATRDTDWRSHFRLMFKQSSLLLSTGKKAPGGEFEYESAIEYQGLNDTPSDFAGNVYLAQQTPGHLNILSVNRDSGTATWTIAGAADTEQYPWATTAFYVCGPR